MEGTTTERAPALAGSAGETPAAGGHIVLPYSFARRHGAVLRRHGGGGVECVFRSALPLEALIEIQRVTGPDLVLLEVDEPDFEKIIGQAYRDSASEAADEAAAADSNLAALADSAAAVDDLLDQKNDAPVVRLINALLLEAVKEGASDIHIETHEKRLAVRFRVDGVLRKMIEPKRSLAPLLVSRIKVMARLDIAEKRLPQDGRVSLRVGDHEVDVRVSTIPSQYGERVVMRLLDRDGTRLGCDAIGMSERDLLAFQRMLRRPEGIVLVTGPTGSGKSTTLYAALGDLNDNVRNIMTVEDPIVAEALNISRAEAHGVATFYHDYRTRPAGRHVLKLCRAEACQSMGGDRVARLIQAELGVGMGETAADDSVTVEPVYCLGLCACAPAAMLDGVVIGRLDAEAIAAIAAEVRR